MPLYAYRCTQCGHRFEKIQRFKDKPEKVCPQCGGALERPLTAPGLQFKGAGWYVNDYAPKSSAAGDAAPAEKKASSESKTETKAKTAAVGGSGTVSDSGQSSSAAPITKAE